MSATTDDVRIESLRPLISPAILMEELPVGEGETKLISDARQEVARIVTGEDDRLVIVVGPCSIHDPEAGLEYAAKLKPAAEALRADLKIVMRTYFEKPRTTVGWKGLINDPKLDGSFSINQGLRVARKFLLDVVELGMPTGTEFLDPISPQFMADLVAWGAIGARTTESQVHRELASGLSMPVGFKNGTSGNVQIAVDAVRSAAEPHRFLSVTKQGLAAIVATRGNKHCHVILRGGRSGPNYSQESVSEAAQALGKAGLRPALMVDCSHANSQKDHKNQVKVAEALAAQVSSGHGAVFVVMIESNLVEGRQDVTRGKSLTHGQSITDACLGFDQTLPVLELLASAVRARRKANA
jgi:3-deoxy-7-phosphoheptulonate synthase